MIPQKIKESLLNKGWRKKKGYSDITFLTDKFEFRYIDTTNQLLIWSKTHLFWECLSDITIERIESVIFGLTGENI